MPLYMNFQVVSAITTEQIKKAHMANQAVQERYHVKYLQFWVNEAAGTIFCLMEGPDKEACEIVHRKTHGNTACEIIEVVPGMHNLLRGENYPTDSGWTPRKDPTGDHGYRFVVVIDFAGNDDISLTDYKNLKLHRKPKVLAMNKINKFQGKVVRHSGDDNMTAVFMAADDAAKCAVEIQAELKEKSKDHVNSEWNIPFKIGISGGQFKTENDRFFEEAIQVAQRITSIAGNQEIITTTQVEKMSAFDEIFDKPQSIRVISQTEEKFLVSLLKVTEDNLTDKNFNVECLGRTMGISRPQLYRKMVSITGFSPNGFIRNLRMQKAFSLIRKKQYNISEVALEVGINNPSYFSKCFHERFGVIPSRVMC